MIITSTIVLTVGGEYGNFTYRLPTVCHSRCPPASILGSRFVSFQKLPVAVDLYGTHRSAAAPLAHGWPVSCVEPSFSRTAARRFSSCGAGRARKSEQADAHPDGLPPLWRTAVKSVVPWQRLQR